MSQTPIVIEQSITAGSQFNELPPTTEPADSDAIRVFPTDIQGGEFVFDFSGPAAPWVSYQIDQIFVDFGDAVTAEVAIVWGAKRVVLASPGAGLYLNVTPFELMWDQKLTLKTLGATAALTARIVASPKRSKTQGVT